MVAGEYADGRQIDLQREAPLPVADRRWLWGPTSRFKKYEENVGPGSDEAFNWARYHCDRQLADGLEAVTVQFWRRGINEMGDPAGVYQPATMQELASISCSP